jgi:hypothetical protein
VLKALLGLSNVISNRPLIHLLNPRKLIRNHCTKTGFAFLPPKQKRLLFCIGENIMDLERTWRMAINVA